MIDIPSERGDFRPWIVCENGDRWIHVVRRFALEMMPAGLFPVVIAADAGQVRKLAWRRRSAILLLESQPASLAATCDVVADVSIAAPETLQIVASETLSPRASLVLSELRVAATIRHPEDLQSLSSLIRGYFASDN